MGDETRSISLSLTSLLDTRGNRFAFGSSFLLRDGNQNNPLQPRSTRLGFDLAFDRGRHRPDSALRKAANRPPGGGARECRRRVRRAHS
ncbi:hypothetical protein SLG_27100 [Sphingobium sp. SYK-6]|uniref:hypothetical protein n=1 Tax=Sphingobium sp. (strain NBRC 103272 / SYK-6) TaxID=627192 RepID=UPI0002277005|nr:hypothetical protein [Sphingobium sp. SYK-6]BAK67385.1 hypothetical protein SLG_27100 [Sphingobium sp. SYK-6]